MIKQKINSLILLSIILGASSAHAQDVVEDDDSIDLADGLSLTPENPFTPFAIKKNGKARRKFKVPFSTIKEYYAFAGQGFIKPNEQMEDLIDINMDVVSDKTIDNVNFFVNMKSKSAYSDIVLDPTSVSKLFYVDPKVYNDLGNGSDFLEAKRNIYGATNFNKKSLRYDYNMVHIEDWRSLNHPPVHELGDDLTVWNKDLSDVNYDESNSVYFSEEFNKKVDALSDTELSFGNKTHLMENGTSFQRKILEVKNAKKSVLMAVMSFFCDTSSRHLEDALIAKAQEGKDVKLIVEKVWTNIIGMKCLNRMRRGGVDVALANDLLKKGDQQSLFHSKFIVVDSEKVIIGGENILDSDNISTGYNHMNRDLDVFIEGPMAIDATKAYVTLWKRFQKERNADNVAKGKGIKDISEYEQMVEVKMKEQRAQGIRGQENYAAKLGDKSTRNSGVCRFVNQNPSTDRNKLSKVFIEYIGAAESKLNLTNGSTFYFDMPDQSEKEKARDTWNKKLYRTIFATTDRGIKLDIIGNGIDGGYGEASNIAQRMYLKNRYKLSPLKGFILALSKVLNKTAAKGNQPYLEALAKRDNIRAWTLFQYNHSKKMQLDRTVSVIGSYNLEEWSSDKSHETAVLCMDKDLSHEMDRSFLKDMVNSTPAAITE